MPKRLPAGIKELRQKPEAFSASDLPQRPTHHADAANAVPPKPHAPAVAVPTGPASTHQRFHPSDGSRRSKRVVRSEPPPDVLQRPWVAGP